MKYIIVLGDGMADEPIASLNDKTPLEYAKTPAMDDLSKKGEIGMVHTIPEGMAPGSDTANLAVMGYDPQIYYSGRSPLEALSIGVPMKADDIALKMVKEVYEPIVKAIDPEYSVCVDERVMPNRYCFFVEGNGICNVQQYATVLDDSLSKKNRDYEDLRQFHQVAAPVCIVVEEGSHAAWKEKQGKAGHNKPVQLSMAEGFLEFMTERERKIGTKK